MRLQNDVFRHYYPLSKTLPIEEENAQEEVTQFEAQLPAATQKLLRVTYGFSDPAARLDAPPERRLSTLLPPLQDSNYRDEG